MEKIQNEEVNDVATEVEERKTGSDLESLPLELKEE